MIDAPRAPQPSLQRLRFPFQVEILLPQRPATRETMHRWCLGKPYRVVPRVPQPGQLSRWLFTKADDADFFQATFGGRIIDPAD